MDYQKLIEMIPIGKWEIVSDKLIDFILTSKNDDKMPAQLANVILYQWQNGTLKSETGITALLQAAVILEPEKTITSLNELQMTSVAEQIKETLGS